MNLTGISLNEIFPYIFNKKSEKKNYTVNFFINLREEPVHKQ